MPLRAIVFDLFDTLVDLDGGSETLRESTRRLLAAVREHVEIDSDAFAGALRAVDADLREPRYAQGLEVSSQERFAGLAARLGIGDPALPERLTRIHMDVIRGAVRVPGHHARLLRELAGRARLGVCSNFSHAPTARAILEAADLSAPLEAVVISVEVGVRKPRREIFEAVLDALGTPPGQTLHVGDSLRADVAGAAALGLATAWLTRRVPDPASAREAHAGPAPDHVVADLREVAGLLA
jgi:FMN phosphatase YigB (HAD superfamily)